MSLIGSVKGSNALDKSGERDAQDGDASKLGYVKVDFPAEQPATANKQIATTGDFGFTEVNQGTSVGSYKQQPATISSESGK